MRFKNALFASTRNRQQQQQQHGDHGDCFFVTKQQRTINIIMLITKTVLTIAADAVSLLLIVVSLLKGMIWLDMVST
jgi:hypothetical protein